MNLTDVDDKTIRNTIDQFGEKAGVKDLKKYTNKYSELFLTALDKLNISRRDINFVKVSDVIPEIQDFILKLITKGYAYKADDGSTYFNIEKYQTDFGHYGELVGEKFLEGKKIGARVKVDEYDKDSVINHISFGGEITDIHTGGVDLIFPHHTNEIAQSEALTGKPFVKNWLHSEHILVDGKKMSKSLGNIFTLKDLEERGYNPLAYRYLLLQTNYKQKVNFTWESLEASAKGYQNIKNKITKLKKSAGLFHLWRAKINKAYITDFSTKIESLNTASALASLQSVLSAKDLTPAEKLKLIREFDKILGLRLL